MHGDEVGALEQVREAYERDVEKLRALDRDHRVESDDVHLQPVRALGDFRADVAQPHHAKRLAADLGADELRSRPLPALDGRVRLRHPSREGEDEGDRVLGGGHDVAARRVDDDDAFARRRRDVNVVHAHPRAADDAQTATGLDDRRGDACLTPDDQRVELGDAPDQLGFFQLADHRDLARAAQPLEAVLGQRIGDEDLDHGRKTSSGRRRERPGWRR